MKTNNKKQEVPRTLTNSQCDELIGGFSGEGITPGIHERRKRNKLMIMMLIDTGLRVNELIQLRVKHLIFDAKVVESLELPNTIAKGGRGRLIPLTERLQLEIYSYITLFFCSNLPNPDFFIFANFPGANHISARLVQRVCSIGGLAFLGINVNPHMLRHTFGTRLMRIAPIEVVRRLMGHACLSSTQIYMHPDTDDLKKAINNL